MEIKERLTRDIINGALPAGARLTQAELAQRFGVSLAPVREALRELNSDGLVEIDPFTGATVHRPTLRSLQSIYEMRLALEPLAVPSRSVKLSPELDARAAHLVDVMGLNVDKASWTVANRQFHSILRSGCANEMVIQAIARLDNFLAMYVSMSIVNRADANEEHMELLEAYRSGTRTQVLRLTKHHIRRTYEACRAVLDAEHRSELSAEMARGE